jgi:hypothetical protein
MIAKYIPLESILLALKSLMFMKFYSEWFILFHDAGEGGCWLEQNHNSGMGISVTFSGWRRPLLEKTFTLAFYWLFSCRGLIPSTGPTVLNIFSCWDWDLSLSVAEAWDQQLGLMLKSLSVAGTDTIRSQLPGLETSNWAYCCNHCQLLGLRLIVVSCRGLRPATGPTVVIIVSCWDWD